MPIHPNVVKTINATTENRILTSILNGISIIIRVAIADRTSPSIRLRILTACAILRSPITLSGILLSVGDGLSLIPVFLLYIIQIYFKYNIV